MKTNFFSSSLILKKFLVFNLFVFLILGVFTYLYLNAIKPNLIKNRSYQHELIINNTTDHIKRLNIKFTREGTTDFLLSTRFLFQNLDRVQLYDLNSILLADTDTLDLVQNIFIRSQDIQETSIDKPGVEKILKQKLKIDKTQNFKTENYVKKYANQKKFLGNSVFSETINNNFYVMTINSVKINDENLGYIIVSEIANDILIAVDERKNFILRTVFFVGLVILLFFQFS